MPVSVVCPGCSAKLNAPDAAAGKRVKCPKCQQPIAVPAAVADFEVVEAEPAPPPKKPAPKPAAKPQVKTDVVLDDDEEDEKPAKKRAKAVVEEDDEDERPRKKKKADEDEDEQPKKKRKAAAAESDEDEDGEKPKKKKKKRKADEEGGRLVRNIVGGVVLVILLGVVGFVYYDKFGKKDKDETAAAPKDDATPVVNPRPQPGPRPNPGPGPKEPKGPDTGTGRVNQKIGVAKMGGPILTGDGKLLLARHVIVNSLLLGIWDVQTGSQFASIGDDEKYSVDAYGISPDRKQAVIVSHAAKTLTFWTAPAGQLEKEIKLTHWKDGLRIPSFATYTPDGQAVLIGYEGALLRVEVQTGAQQVVLKGIDTVSARYSPDANRFVDVFFNPSGRTELRVIDPARPTAPALMPLKDDESPQSRPDISSDGKTLAAVVTDRTDFQNPKVAVHLYDVNERKLKGKVSLPAELAGAKGVQIHDVRVSPDGVRVAFCVSAVQNGKNAFACWVSGTTGENSRRLGEWSGDFAQITTFTRDGKSIAVLSNRLRIYDTETGKDIMP